MNEEQYKQVCEACDSVLLSANANLETIAIPWLHVIREHPSFLKDYEALYASSSASRDTAKTIACKARHSAGWLRQAWRALLSDGEPWKASKPLDAPVDVLFVSHMLNDSDAGKNSDFYFGNLPEVLKAEGRRVVVALIDHSSRSNSSLVRSWDTNASTRVLLSGSLDFRGELSVYRRLRRESLRLAALSRMQTSGFMKRVLSFASLEAMSGRARTTLRMAVQIDRLVATIKPKMMILTYEGHAWERSAFAAARQALSSVQCVGYQHAAIFRLQHGALRKLGALFDPDVILTAGRVSKRQIEASIAARGIPVRVLGSSRAFVHSKGAEVAMFGAGNETADLLATTAGNVCLVLPEGIVSECVILVEFCLSCAELMPEMHFILRLHPLVTPETLLRAIPRLMAAPANFELSQAAVEDDIRRASVALYRGSTAIVRAACSGVQPVYLAQDREMTVDPLYELADSRVSVISPSEFKAKMGGETTALGAALRDREAVVRYCEDFYSPLDSEVVQAALR
ncbi:MAG: hypothetical protein V4573_08565 [Pseudomonadota bacterium]